MQTMLWDPDRHCLRVTFQRTQRRQSGTMGDARCSLRIVGTIKSRLSLQRCAGFRVRNRCHRRPSGGDRHRRGHSVHVTPRRWRWHHKQWRQNTLPKNTPWCNR